MGISSGKIVLYVDLHNRQISLTVEFLFVWCRIYTTMHDERKSQAICLNNLKTRDVHAQIIYDMIKGNESDVGQMTNISHCV